MNQKATNETVFLKNCFYLCFHSPEEYKVTIKEFINSNGDKLSFKILEFLDYLKVQKETYGLIPIDVFYDDFCTKNVLQKIAESFEEAKSTGGYTRLFLEYLFDERFKEEFNHVVKEKLEPVFNKNYFATKVSTGDCNFDMVGQYFEAIKDSWRGADAGYDFSLLTDRKAVYSTKDEAVKQGVHGTEKLDNIFSLYKFYGQEKYSRILISFLHEYNSSEKSLQPKKLLDMSSDIIFQDKEISKTRPDEKTPEVLRQRIDDLELNKIQYELQRFFDNYIPSHLDHIFVLNSEKHKNETLRELLVRDFNGILSEEWKLYKKLKCNEELYEKISSRRNFYSYYELQIIEDVFGEIIDSQEGYNLSLGEKIEYIQTNCPELYKESVWKTIFEKYKEYYSLSYEENIEIVEKQMSEKQNEVDNTDIETITVLFENFFDGEQQFISELKEDLLVLTQRFDGISIMRELKGSPDHPWSRFWTIYNRESENHKYPEKKKFTKIMNHIESEIKKTINEE